MAGFPGKLFGGLERAFIGIEGIEQAYGEAAGRTKAGPGMNISHRGDLYSALNPDQLQGFSDQRMAYFVDTVNNLRFGIITYPDSIGEAFVDDDVHISVYRRAYHSSGFIAIEFTQIGPATDKADSERCSRNYHQGTFFINSAKACCCSEVPIS